ncbi:MAG: hypothetical protein ACRDPF_32830 [Streptosporangiaceae bacterium]
MPRVGGAVVADPTGVGELPVGVAEGRAVCDGLGDRVGEGEVCVGAAVDAVGEGLAAGWVAGAGPGETRK